MALHSIQTPVLAAPLPSLGLSEKKGLLQQYIRSNKGMEAVELVKRNTEILFDLLPNGEYPYSYAIRSRCMPLIDFITRSDISQLLEVKDHQGLTPTDHAMLLGDEEIIAKVMGAKIHRFSKEMACQPLDKKQLGMLIDLVQSVDSIGEKGGMSPLQSAVLKGDIRQANLLYQQTKHRSDLTQDRKNLLHLAVLSKNGGMIDWVLDRQRIDINQPDAQGRTPLHFAMAFFVKEGRNDLVTALLKRGANPLIHSEKCPLTPIQIMAEPFRRRADVLDPMKIPLSEKILCAGIVGSTLFYQYHLNSKVLQKALYFTHWLGLSEHGVIKTFWQWLIVALIGFKFQKIGNYLTMLGVAKSAYKALSVCWRNRHIESPKRMLTRCAVPFLNVFATYGTDGKPLYEKLTACGGMKISNENKDQIGQCILDEFSCDPSNPEGALSDAKQMAQFGSKENIRSNLRDLSKFFHPDQSGTSPVQEKISNCINVLKARGENIP